MTWSSALVVAYIAVALVLPIGSPTPSVVRAKDTGEESDQGAGGLYQIDVVAEAIPRFSGDVRFVITVRDAETRQPVPSAYVRIVTSNQDDGTGGWAIALNTPQAPQRYEANVRLRSSGTWAISVEVSSAIGNALVDVPALEVRDPESSVASSFVFVGVLVVFALGGVYVWLRIRQERRKRAAAMVLGGDQH